MNIAGRSPAQRQAGGVGGWGGLDRAEVALASHGEVCYGAFDHSCDEARLTTCGGGVKRCGPSKVW